MRYLVALLSLLALISCGKNKGLDGKWRLAAVKMAGAETPVEGDTLVIEISGSNLKLVTAKEGLSVDESEIKDNKVFPKGKSEATAKINQVNNDRITMEAIDEKDTTVLTFDRVK